MSNGTKDMVTEQRHAFLAGAAHIRNVYGLPSKSPHSYADSAEAVRQFPMPKVPREVAVLGDMIYRFVNGQIEYKTPHTVRGWCKSGSYQPEVIKALADLMANPEVEAS